MSWLKAAAIRAVRTGAQVAIATIGASVAFSEVRWDEVSGVVGLSMILSLLTSLAGLPETPQDSPVQAAIHKDQGQSILVVAAVAAVVCLAILLLTDVIHIN